MEIKMRFYADRRNALKKILMLAAGAAILGVPALSISADKEANMLIIYFSHTGNTRAVANEIQAFTGAAMIELQPETPFPTNHDACVEVAERQARENYRPKISNKFPANINDYDMVFLGFPIWAYTMPMIIYSFLDQYKFPGKKIAPFSTNMGSGLADAPEQIAKLCPQATVLPGLAIWGKQAANSKSEVGQWLKKLGIVK